MTDAELCGADIYLDENADIKLNYQDDFITISGKNNLKQAIASRMKIGTGELTLHPNYGTELIPIIGKINNSLLLSEIRQKVRKALIQEPRVETINSIKVKYAPGTNDRTVIVDVDLIPINATEPLNIIYPIFLTA